MHYLGIDVSKLTLDVCLLAEDSDKPRHRRFDNNRKGHGELIKWVRNQGAIKVHACLEPTATYGLDIAERLVEEGFKVSMVNPAKINAFARALLRRCKNDKVDAETIALFCKRMSPLPWSPPSTETRRLRTLTRRLQDLKDIRQQERNRLEGAPTEMHASISRMLDCLEEELDLIQCQIDEIIHEYPEISAQVKLLTSIKGIGRHTACVLLAEIGNLSQFHSARELAAYAGLVPRKETSGTSINRPARMMKAGNVILRKALFMPALVSAKHNPVLVKVYQRLTSKGKTKMSALGAVMRRLLHIVFGVLTHRTPFDPAYASIANQPSSRPL